MLTRKIYLKIRSKNPIHSKKFPKNLGVSKIWELRIRRWLEVTWMLLRPSSIGLKVTWTRPRLRPFLYQLRALSNMTSTSYDGPWTSPKIRQTYIEYFEKKGHTFWPSSSTIPFEDPTLLFANAGMNQVRVRPPKMPLQRPSYQNPTVQGRIPRNCGFKFGYGQIKTCS